MRWNKDALMLRADVHTDQTRQAAALRSTNPVLAGCGLLHQLCCGYAIFLPFAGLRCGTVDESLASLSTAMLSAGLLIGAGTGFPLHLWFCRVRGILVSTRISLISTAAGIIVAAAGSVPWCTLTGCTLIGAGLFGEWTPSSEMTRCSLSSRHLWRVMRIHTLLLFTGALLAVVITPLGAGISLVTSTVIALTCGVVAGVLRPIQAAPNSGVSAALADQTVCLPPSLTKADTDDRVTDNASNPSVSSSDSAAGHDIEKECCGGGTAWTPMPVWLGACIAFVGMYTFGVTLPHLVSNFGQLSPVLVIAGSLLGTVVFQTVVPSAGYCILMGPTCLVGTVVFGFSPWLPSDWSVFILPGQGAVAAAIWCGCSGITGESFVDGSRSFVLMTGSLSAAALGIFTGIGTTLVSPVVGPVIGALICFVAILCLRRIRSPLISQRPQEEVSGGEAHRMLSDSLEAAGGISE